MRSLRRIDSSRANGARSRGPITPEGKERASTNALRHGLLAKCLVLENESNECFDDLVTQHIRRFAPADGVEFAMIEEMVAANWRMRRAWAIENRLMDQISPPATSCRVSPTPSPNWPSPPSSTCSIATRPASTASTSALWPTSSCLANPNYQTNPVPFPNSAPRWRRVPAVTFPSTLTCSETTPYQTNLIPFPDTVGQDCILPPVFNRRWSRAKRARQFYQTNPIPFSNTGPQPPAPDILLFSPIEDRSFSGNV